jgi:hypothetical protein
MGSSKLKNAKVASGRGLLVAVLRGGSFFFFWDSWVEEDGGYNRTLGHQISWSSDCDHGQCYAFFCLSCWNPSPSDNPIQMDLDLERACDVKNGRNTSSPWMILPFLSPIAGPIGHPTAVRVRLAA